MRKIICILFVVLTFSACGDKTGQRQLNVAIIGKARVSYWDDVKAGAAAAGKDLGVKVSYYAPSKEDTAWQIRKIEEIINGQIDGIAFAASNPKSIAPTIMKAMQYNIPCVALDTDVAKSRHAYIGTGNYYAGQQAGERMIELLDGKGKVAIIAEISTTDFIQRIQGFRDVIAEHKNIEIATSIEKENDIVRPSDVESLLPALNLDGIFCVSDSVGLVIGQVVKKTNKQIKIVCIGESPGIMKLVKEDLIQAAISRRPYRMGYISVLVLHNMAKTGINNAMMILPKSEIIDPGVIIVTQSNIDQYLEQLAKLKTNTRF